MKSALLSLLSGLASEPSALAIQRFSLPSRSLVNAIRFPSGEKTGWLSKASPLVIGLAWPREGRRRWSDRLEKCSAKARSLHPP